MSGPPIRRQRTQPVKSKPRIWTILGGVAVVVALLLANYVRPPALAPEETTTECQHPPRPVGPHRTEGLYRFLLVLILGITGAVYLHSTKWHLSAYVIPTRRVPVPKSALGAYHFIHKQDITFVNLPQNTLPETTVHKAEELVDHYTLTALPANRPVLAGQVHILAASSLVANQDIVTMGVPATAAMVQAGGLQRGEVVDILFQSGPEHNISPPDRLSGIVVLDVKPGIGQKEPGKSDNAPYVVILALRRDQCSAFMMGSRNTGFNLIRRP